MAKRIRYTPEQIIMDMPINVLCPVVEFPGMKELIDIDSIEDVVLATAFGRYMK